jgi:hypothetical protein
LEVRICVKNCGNFLATTEKMTLKVATTATT